MESSHADCLELNFSNLKVFCFVYFFIKYPPQRRFTAKFLYTRKWKSKTLDKEKESCHFSIACAQFIHNVLVLRFDSNEKIKKIDFLFGFQDFARDKLVCKQTNSCYVYTIIYVLLNKWWLILATNRSAEVLFFKLIYMFWPLEGNKPNLKHYFQLVKLLRLTC